MANPVARPFERYPVLGEPMEYLGDDLLGRLTAIESLDILPAGRALAKYADGR
jgi:hypothetical protein